VSSAREQIHPLNWVRAFAALLVCCFHASLVLGLPKYLGTEPAPVFAAGFSGVQLFFVLSGMVILLAHREDPQRSGPALGRFLTKRFLRIYPTLWIVLLALVPLTLSGWFGERPVFVDIVSAFLITPIDREVILAVEWTLRHEVLFYALFCAFLWDRRAGVILLGLWGIVGSLLGFLLESPWWARFLLDSNHALFVMGMVVAVMHGRASRVVAIASSVAGIVVFAAVYGLTVSRHIGPPLQPLGFGIGAALLLHGLSNLPGLNVPRPLLNYLGAASYSLYLIHLPLVSAMAKVVAVADGYLQWPHLIYFAIIVFACQLAACAFHSLVELPLLVRLRRWRMVSAPAGSNA